MNGPVEISVTSAGDEFIVFYVLMSGNWDSFRARKVDVDGDLLSDPMPFQVPANGFVHGARAALNGLDQLGVAWIERDSNGSEVWFQGYTLVGDAVAPTGDPQMVRSTDDYAGKVAIATSYSNRFVVAWNEAEGGSVGDPSDVYVRRMHVGYPSGYNPICVDCDGGGPLTADTDPSVALVGNFAYVSWTKAEEGAAGDIYASRVYLGPER